MPEEVKQDSLAVPEMSPQVAAVLKQPPQSAKVTRAAAFTPVNLTEAIALAKLMARSALVPNDYRNKPENVLIGMQYAAELGIPPLLGLQNISIINGRASVWGDLFLALIQSSPDYEWHEEKYEGTGDEFGAVCVMKRKGSSPHTVKFTVADAKTAKLWGKVGPWQTNPKRMLQMRSRGFAGRDKFSDALKGLIIAEEAMDIPPDNSEAKKARETGTLDVTATLTASSEPNRGHGDEGMQRSSQNSPSNEGGKQEVPKQDPVMCGDCQKIDGHDKTCKHYDAWIKQQQDAKTSKPVTETTVKIDKIDHMKKVDKKTNKRTGPPYLILTVTDADDLTWALYVWDTKFHEVLDKALGKVLICEFAENKQGEKTFCSLEHILYLGGVQFVNDAPAQSAEMPVEEREPGQDDPENW